MGTILVSLFTLFKLGKLGGTLITMIVSIAVYAQIYGWGYAVGFVGLLFVHEMGHFVAAKQRALPVSAPTFIPFVGAWIQLKDQPMDVETEAYVAIAGPALGTLGAVLVYFWARWTDSELLLAVAYGGFFLNFFNLIPLSPLDGGRITAVLGPRIWFIGVPIMLALMVWRPSPLLILIAVMAVPALREAWHYDPQAPENQAYYSASAETKIQYGALYLALAAFLAVMTEATHTMIAN